MPFKGVLICILTAYSLPVLPVTPQQQETGTITIPDGVKVELRFAQPLRSPIDDFPWTDDVGAAKEGDKVRLVTAENLRVEGQLVVARGAIAEATVTRSYAPNRNTKYPDIDTGLDIRLDWVETITHERIRLRGLMKGKSKGFHIMVLSSGAGYLAKPDTVRHEITRAMTLRLGSLREDMKKKDWLPTGTHITTFVQGPVRLDRAEIIEAQAQFPTPDTHAELTFYRLKDHHGERVDLSCDGKTVAQIGSRQSVVLELEPGEHSCMAASENNPVKVTAKPGEEYFFRLRPHFFAAGWEVKQVGTAEGEDGIATTEMILK